MRMQLLYHPYPEAGAQPLHSQGQGSLGGLAKKTVFSIPPPYFLVPRCHSFSLPLPLLHLPSLLPLLGAQMLFSTN